MRKVIKSKRLVITSILLLWVVQLCAQNTFHKEIPDVPLHPALVNDLGNMLSDEEELKLETKLLAFERKTSNEVTIVTVESLGDLDVNTFALELGRKWDIGKETRKNGVLVLASKNDRKINIAPGYGLQGALPDVIAGRIIRDEIVPNFKNGNYYQGFEDATTSIIKATEGEFINSSYESEGTSGIGILLMLLFLFGFIFIFFYLTRNRRNIYVSRRGYKYDDNGWDSLPRSGTGWFTSGGWGDSGSDSGGGGFGGFGGGGGGFDGGGASGSW